MASRSLSWGRSGGKVPVSRVGYAVWGCTFIVIAGVLIKRNDIPIMLVHCSRGMLSCNNWAWNEGYILISKKIDVETEEREKIITPNQAL